MNKLLNNFNFLPNVKIFDRYIFTELLGPYLFGIFGFVVVISIDPLIYAMKNIINSAERGIEVISVIKWFIYSLASDMIFTFPMAMLLSTLIVFGRLSKDSELTAIKACGISFMRICVPVMFFALLVTIIAFLFNEYVVPYAVKRSQLIKRTQILKLLPVMGQENIYVKDSPNRTIYVERADNVNNILTNIIISNYDEETNLLRTRVFAKTARYINNNWIFSDGVVYEYDNLGIATKVEEFYQKKIFINQKPSDFKRDEQTHQEMSMRELSQKIQYAYNHGLSEVTSLLVEFYLKTSIPFSCFIFALIGASLGTTNSRTGGFINFGISMIIIFIYYVIFSISRSFGKNGLLTPIVSAWLQNIIFLIAGLILIKRVKN